MDARLDADPVESAALGLSVARCWIEAGAGADLGALRRAAEAVGHRLVVIASPEPLAPAPAELLGTLAQYAAPLDSVSERLPRTTVFTVTPATAADWSVIEALLDHAAPNRFDRDPRIDAASARARKIAMLRAREAEGGATALGATATGPCGFQTSYVSGDLLVLYELATIPGPARAILAVEMIAANMEALAARYPAVARVSAYIYTDNAASMAFFHGLGLRPTGHRLWQYHLWV